MTQVECQVQSESRSVVSDSVTPEIVATQAPLSMEFSRQEYWSGLPFPSSGHLPDPGIKPRSLALQADFFYHLSLKYRSSPNAPRLPRPPGLQGAVPTQPYLPVADMDREETLGLASLLSSHPDFDLRVSTETGAAIGKETC